MGLGVRDRDANPPSLIKIDDNKTLVEAVLLACRKHVAVVREGKCTGARK